MEIHEFEECLENILGEYIEVLEVSGAANLKEYKSNIGRATFLLDRLRNIFRDK